MRYRLRAKKTWRDIINRKRNQTSFHSFESETNKLAVRFARRWVRETATADRLKFPEDRAQIKLVDVYRITRPRIVIPERMIRVKI